MAKSKWLELEEATFQDRVVLLDPFQIVLEDRQRAEMGSILELAESIDTDGQVVPIIVDGPEYGPFRVVDGGRRLTACQRLYRFVRAVVSDKLTISDYAVIEFITNEHRKPLTPMETVMSIKHLHDLFCLEHANAPKAWSIRDTAKRLSKSHTYVTDCLHQAAVIESGELSGDLKKMTFKQLRTETNRIRTAEKILNKVPKKLQVITEQGTEDRIQVYAEDFLSRPTNELLQGLLPEGSIDVIITDPNWGINLNQNRVSALREGTSFDDTDETATKQELLMFQQFAEVLDPDNGILVCFCAIDKFSKWAALALAAGFARVSPKPFIWVKSISGDNQAPQLYPTSCYETALIAHRGVHSVLNKQGLPDWKQIPPVPPTKLKHVCEKPIDLWEYLLLMVCEHGSVVLDPFMGSGGSLRAAYDRDCSVIGLDKNPTCIALAMSQFVSMPDEEEEEDV